MSSTPLNPLFFIDAIEMWWKHDNMLHVDNFYSFFRYRSVPMGALDYRSYIVDFYVWWTQPMPSYYHFVMLVPEIVITSESHSLSLDDSMSSARSNSSSEDTNVISSTPMSPRSMLPES
ncbi:hypothetical protein GYH30_018175 [Glycine max]|nr:hypothetical protein GYH30_018175 [Glycine max]